MRKFIFIYIVLLINYNTNAQVIDSVTTPLFSDTTSQLNKAFGWLLQNNGEWVSAKNKIPNDKTVIYSKSDEYKIGKDNFSSIELTNFNYLKNKYVLLVIKFKDGYYEFPNLKSKWTINNKAVFYVFRKEKLQNLIPDTTVYDNPYSVNMDIYCSGLVNLDCDKLGIRNIVTETVIKTQKQIIQNHSNLIFSINTIKKDENQIVRFKLIRTYVKKALFEYYLQPSIQKEIFRKSFYETDFTEFNEFITRCLDSTEKRILPIYDFSKEKNIEEDEFISNYNSIKKQLKNFNTTSEKLNIDTSSFYAPVKISQFADTVAATSFIKPTRNNKKVNKKTQNDTTTLNYNRLKDTLHINNQNSKVDSLSNQLLKKQSKIILRIQFTISNSDLFEDFYRKKYGIKEKIHIIPFEKDFIYAVGEFYNFTEANAYRNTINMDYGIADALIIALEDNKLTDIAKAKKILK